MRSGFFALTGLSFIIPCVALAATGGVGGGFGADDWLRKWPVLAVVFVLVIGTTSFLITRVLARAKAKGEAK